jgi:hypothetical protein
MAPLPLSLPEHFQLDMVVFTAYVICREIERQIVESVVQLKSTISPLVSVRILGWLLIYTPTDTGRTNIGREITSCESLQKVIDLGVHYHNHFIRCCERLIHRFFDSTHQFCYLLVKSAKGPTPTPTEHPSRPSFDVEKTNVQQKLQRSPESHQAAKSTVSEVIFHETMCLTCVGSST